MRRLPLHLVPALLDPKEDVDLLPLFDSYPKILAYKAASQLDYTMPTGLPGPDLKKVCPLLRSKDQALRARSVGEDGASSGGAAACAECPKPAPGGSADAVERLARDARVASGPWASCIVCHTGPRHTAVRIPFDNDEALKAAMDKPLREGAGKPLNQSIWDRVHRVGDGQMPPGGFSGAEKKAIEDYFGGKAP